MPVAFFMALQFLREGKTQSLLISAAIGVGVAVIVFLSALIGGLQDDLIAKTLGTQPHVSLALPDEEARPLWVDEAEGVSVLTRTETAAQRGRGITDWKDTLASLEANESIEAVSPIVAGAGFAVRGAVSRSINLIGIDPERYVRVIDVPSSLLRGRMVRGGGEAIVGITLAEELGIDVGAKLRVQAAGAREERLTVVGVFDLGNQEVNERWVLTPLRAGQTLLDRVGAVSQIDLRLSDPFQADQVALELGDRTGLAAESWMEKNAQLLSALSSQSASSILIQFFVVLSVSIGIASVLVVSVVQRRRQIGILRAMGLSRGKVARVFMWQGTLLGILGSIAGVGLGVAIARLFIMNALDEKGEPIFPISVDTQLMVTASLIAVGVGVVAAAWPSLRASALDPAEAIRNE